MYTVRCHVNTWEPLIWSKERYILSKETHSTETPFWFHQERLVSDQKRPVSHEKRRVFHQKSRMFHKMRLHHVLSKDACISFHTDTPWKETRISKETPSQRKTQSHTQQRALSIKKNLYSIKRDLQYMERDPSHIQRHTPITYPKTHTYCAEIHHAHTCEGQARLRVHVCERGNICMALLWGCRALLRTLVRVRPACGYMYVSVEMYVWLFCGDIRLFCRHLWASGLVKRGRAPYVYIHIYSSFVGSTWLLHGSLEW